VALLADSGYDVRLAVDGVPSLDIVSQWRVDLILLDLLMSGYDSWSFLTALANHHSSHRPAVLVWSVATPDEAARASALGAHICQPQALTEPNVLLSTIARLLRG
jgi:two-component system alkaline phosphatase synthesis response regulator PhoP